MPSEPRRPGRYPILLASLLLIVAVRPLVVGQYLSGLLIEAAAALLILVFVASMRWHLLAIAVALVVASTLSSVLLGVTWQEASPDRHFVLTMCSLASTLAFLGFVCGVILHEVLLSVPVTWNTVCGALCVYLLAGALWANVYLLTYLLDPGSFAGASMVAGPLGSPGALDRHSAAFLYYSFTTLGTLGLGDFTPRSPLTRTLSWVEAVFGQVYLAVLVARLIGLQRPPGEGEDARTR